MSITYLEILSYALKKPEIVHKIESTGNPFVDTRLAVIAHLSDCNSIDDLTLADMRSLHGNGESLARNNIELKSTYRLFGEVALFPF
jgi:hypothetical protein